MKKLLLGLCCLGLGISPLFSVPGEVVYTEGEAAIKYQTGDEYEAYIGDTVNTGDTVTTGGDGYVELDRSSVIIKVNPDTVFTLLEREENREKADMLSVVLGSIRFRYDKITGREPKIQTGSCVAGVRGTEFQVFAGVDGSSLIAVDQGIVTVESEGQSVELTAAEGVEVQPGEPPGQKFQVQRDQIDYSSWNGERLDALLADPLAAITRLNKRLEFYAKNVADYHALFQEYSRKLQEARQKSGEIAQKEGEKASKEYYDREVFPLAVDTGNLVLNYRYFTLAALSLRRYVAGRIYLTMKTRYITRQSDRLYQDFLSQYRQLLARFETSIAPRLVEADI